MSITLTDNKNRYTDDNIWIDNNDDMYNSERNNDIDGIENNKTDNIQIDGNTLNSEIPTLKQYTSGWFFYETCPYVKSRIYRGASYSRSYADGQRGHLDKLILPFFGDTKLNEINPMMIEQWLCGLKERNYAHVSINHYLATLRIILKEAYRNGLIEVDPTVAIRPFIPQSREKGILNDEEVKRLFASESLTRIWNGKTIYRLMNLTSAMTGMRLAWS